MEKLQKIKLGAFLVGSMLLISFSFYFYQIVYVPNILVEGQDKLFVIKSGSTYRGVLLELGRENIVNDMVSFSFLARLKNFDRKISPQIRSPKKRSGEGRKSSGSDYFFACRNMPSL